MKINKEQLLNNPRVQQLLKEEQQVLNHHQQQVQRLKDCLFFGMRFNTQQQLQSTTKLFTNTLIALQCISGIASIYMVYNKKYLPTFILASLTIACGQPISYLLKQRNYIEKELNQLQLDTQQKMNNISNQLQSIISQSNHHQKSFWQKLFH